MKNGSWLACVLATTMVLTGCGRDRDDDKSPKDAKESAAIAAGAALTSAQAGLMGLEVAVLTATTWHDAVRGQAQVLSHETLSQLVADVSAAQAAVQQSAAVLRRTQQLATTAGTLGADVMEQAQRQARTDEVQLQLAQRRLSAQFGAIASAVSSAQLEALAEGRNKLLQVVLPVAPPSGKLAALRFVTLDDGGTAGAWHAVAQWPSPVIAGVTGLSLFAVVAGNELAEGTRLVALAEAGTAVPAVQVPAAAVVVHAGESWCYVQTGTGQYQRRSVDTSHPQAAGYAVTQSLRVGDSVVVQGAGLLLVREFGQEAGEQ